jgi:hypothetical protein
MKFHFQTAVLSAAALISFGDAFVAPKYSDPGRWAAAILGIVLFRRAIIVVPQPSPMILSGCILTAILIAGNHGLLDVNKPVWLAVIVVIGIAYAFWEKIEHLRGNTANFPSA